MELRQTFDDVDDLVIVYAMANNQINDKALRFIDNLGLRERVLFVMDPDGRAIDGLGIRVEDPEAIEAGVPHPATYLIDRDGVVRLRDERVDFHLWLDSTFVREALANVP